MATKKIKRFQEGGMSDKERGLEASKDDKVGFFERLRMGNIDDPSSEAYRRFGAGRGRAESVPVEDRTPTPVIREAAKPASEDMSSMLAAGAEAGKRQPSGDASVAEMYQGPRTKPIVTQQPKPGGKPSVSVAASTKPAASKPAATKAPAMQEQTHTRRSGVTAKEVAEYQPPVSSKYPENRGSVQDSMVAARNRRVREGDEGIERITPETALLPGGSLKVLNEAAKKLAAKGAPKLAEYAQKTLPAPARAAEKALPSPTKKLGYDKAGAIAKRRADRAAKRRDEMLDENAKNYGLDPKAPGYEAASSAVRKEMGGKDFTFKKGGKVKPKKMSSGGSTSPASKRADGIATRGKTRCKIC